MKSIFNRQACTTCLKVSEAFICRGCRRPFCAKHVNQHREQIAKDMNKFVTKCSRLQEESKSEKFAEQTLVSIDQWEKESIEKIRVTALMARADLRPWIERVKIEFEIPFQTLMTEVQSRKKLQDFTEVDLNRWGAQLKELSDKFRQRPVVEYLDCKDAHAIHLIKIIDRVSLASPFGATSMNSISERDFNNSQETTTFDRELFGETYGAITLSENNHIATYTGPWIGDASVYGKNSYSSGVHHLRFRIMDKFYNAPFLGISTASQPLNEHMITCPSIYGWSNFDFPVVNGKEEMVGKDRIIRPGDAVTLTLDCDRRLLLLRHLRTYRLSYLPVDARICPFPWKLLIVLRRRDDAIRLLGGSIGLTSTDLDGKLPDPLKT